MSIRQMFNRREKTCTRCKAVKPISEFGKLTNSKDGYHYYCRKCASAVVQESKRRNRKTLSLNASVGEIQAMIDRGEL